MNGAASRAGLAAVEAPVELGDDPFGLLGTERPQDGVNLFLTTVIALRDWIERT